MVLVVSSKSSQSMTRYTDLTPTQTESGRKQQDRESVSCVVTMIGKHYLRVQVATQTAPPPPSSDAEFLAQVKGASVGIGMPSMTRDLGRKVSIGPFIVLTASKGIASCVGLVQIRYLNAGMPPEPADSPRFWGPRSRQTSARRT